MADLPPSDNGATGEETHLAIEPIEIQQEMEQSFLDYAMSVITARALPDARDGLKPVHRRILWSMFSTGMRPDRPHKKCATVVGDVIGNYHPHGDNAIYEAMVRMGQKFSLANTLIDPHGNFGSPSDPPAAYRYTECRLTDLAMRMVENIDEDTVDLVSTFDGSGEEPVVMPARFPNLLVNGSQGIAVGMATNIPTHNLTEIIDATLHLIDNPEASVTDLMEFVQGPDFPTGGLIMGKAGLTSALTTGRGSIRIRAQAEIVEDGKNTQIVVTEIPYQQSVENIEQKIADAVDRKIIDGIRELRNESAKGKTRFVIELKRDAPASVVLNNLYKHSPLQTSFAANMVALIDGVPRTINLRDALAAYVEHQIDVVTRRSEYRLSQALDRAHIVEGLLRALDLIDEIITLIRGSEDRSSALSELQLEPFSFSERQANHILDMQLGRLTRLGRTRLEEELEELQDRIKGLEEILSNENQLRAVIKNELTEVREEHDTPRRSQIVFDEGDMEVEDLIDNEPVVITLSKGGYIKAVAADTFRTQGRGGRGVQGARLKDDDILVRVLTTTAHSYLLFFTNRGKVYRLKAYQVPMMERTARGTAVVNLLQLEPDEVVEAVIDTQEFAADQFLLFVTRKGVVKKTAFSEYDKNRTNGLIAINLRDQDELVRVIQVRGDDDVVLVSSAGQAIRFAGDQVRPMGRSAAGVRGMKLRTGDVVVAAAATSENDQRYLLTVTEGGYGKRTPIEAYPRKGRGTMGVKGIKLTEARGAAVIGARMVELDDEVIMVSSGGVLIRTAVSEIAEQRRDATGVKVMNVGGDETVAALSPVTLDLDEIIDAETTN
ncbi:MAG TPA: DNA gyrase subunit A [Acidimicrobiaceae bacterium]|nr:MAG: DNA gyrase subunit A [Acidimicrobiaceae bacterium TMED224]HBQ04988.1 DNA gyrase subunit A [Acidimicrobiaceae bacterium]HCJ85565.1 DNA gyrase subunit A [Acidimicrobiaceae bacterium]|tara:strand:- start:278 stop:2776 length:2499 start_codon:yes stop_codon:yes gene_type:complete